PRRWCRCAPVRPERCPDRPGPGREARSPSRRPPVRWAGTHSCPQHAPYRGLDGGDAALSCRADLLGGEGPLDRTQPHREGERLPALPDLLAGEDVEEVDALGEIA